MATIPEYLPYRRQRPRLPRPAQIALLVLLLMLLGVQSARAERIKDLASVAGVRGNALIGYGLVVGLDGTGDQTSQAPFTVQSLKALLQQLGVTVPPGVNPQLKNVAAVAVHAELPAFAKPGQSIDVTVSSIANAGSLRGGALLMTPLKGPDGEVYALAQGNLVVGGLGVNYQRADGIVLAPIRTGVGLRLGANVGTMAYSRQRNILPF